MSLRVWPFILCLHLLPTPAWAHPGVGIVKDPRGVVFYTDLAHIWQIDPTGRRSIAVRNVHTHELALDSAGNLLGEEVRGTGGGWQHRVWRRNPNGELTEVVPWTEGFWQDYGLLQDQAGARYWVTCPERRCRLRRRDPAGAVTVLARDEQFHYPINWLAVTPSGSVFFADGPDLRKVDGTGTLSTVAAALAPPGNQNALLGVHLSRDGAVYVAVPSRRAVVRVASDGTTSVVTTSPGLWAPSGILREADGTLWLLEFNPENRVQVRRIGPDGAITRYEPAA